MNKEKDNTALELVLGIILYGLIVQIVCFFVSEDLFYVSKGLWIGEAVGIAMMIHMKRSIEDAVSLGETGAEKYMTKMFGVRYALVAITLGIALYFDAGHPLSLFAGVMGLKISAYIQPYIHKLLKKRQN